MGRHRAPTVCGTPGCPNDQPCPRCAPKPWAGSNQRRPDALRGRALQQRNARIARRDQGRCKAQHHHPGCDGTGAEVDHIIELADGGTDDDANLALVNPLCHALKTQAHALQARTTQGGYPQG